MGDWDDEEAVAVIGDTSKGIVPSQEGSQETKDTTSLDKFLLWGELGWRVGGSEVTGTQAQKGQIQGEEEHEEGNGGLESAEKQDGGEDEPTLYDTFR